jgi:hypothetical protein
MRDQLQIFHTYLERRPRGAWEWKVCSAAGEVIMYGTDVSHHEARYRANRALFQLLLSAPFYSRRLNGPNNSSVIGLGRKRSTQ